MTVESENVQHSAVKGGRIMCAELRSHRGSARNLLSRRPNTQGGLGGRETLTTLTKWLYLHYYHKCHRFTLGLLTPSPPPPLTLYCGLPWPFWPTDRPC